MNRLLVLLLATLSVGVVAGRVCYNAQWQTLVGKNSIGGIPLTNVTSRAACLDFCAQNSSSCVAVDIEQVGFPPGCWLHLDSLPTDVYDQPTTNQYRLLNCSDVPTNATCDQSSQSTWEVYPNQNSIFATQYVGPRTIQQCLDYCSNNSQCLAVDIDVNQVPLGCWPHFNSNDLIADNVFPQPGTNQYRLIQRCPVLPTTVCYNPDWSVFPGLSAYGALQFLGPTSVQECLDYCGQRLVGCVAADVDMSQTPPACWLHDDISDLADDNIYEQPSVTQYRLVTSCASSPITVPQSTTTTTVATTTVTTTQAPVCPVGRWQLFPEQTAFGAYQYVGPRTIEQCLDYCNRNSSCIAVDIDVDSVPIGCWPHFDIAQMDPDNIYSQPGTTLYKLISRCTNPPPASGCYNPDWSVLYNTSSYGAVEYQGPTSVQECLDYCGQSAAGCVAVDVDLTKDPPTCWPHFDSSALIPSNVYPQNGINQYRLITKCANYPVGGSPPTTTTPAPTTTLGPICPIGRWKILPNQQAVGADQYIGPRTIEQCLAYCNNRTDCVAVDIDMNDVPIGCWPHFSAADLNPDNIYDGMYTYLYQILDRCDNSTVVSECYNPDWSVLVNQSSIGGVLYSEAETDLTVQQCLDVCGMSTTGCVAVDVDFSQQPLKCWLHVNSTNLETLYQQRGVNQYRLVTKCADYPVGASPTVPSTTTVATTTTLGPICPHGRWQMFPNQIADGADQYIGPRTVAQCLDYCNNRTDCVAVDVDVNAVPVGCWPHFSTAALDPSNIYTQSGTVQYRLVDRCTTPSVASVCYNPEWTVLVNQSASGANQHFGTTSVQDCLDYCGQTAVGCVAVDVDLNQNPPSCWPYFSISQLGSENMYNRPLVNQYRLVTKCASSPITTTTTTTLAPIENLSVDVSPAYGPQVGGTSVKITCQTFNMLDIAYVVFGDSIATVQSSTPTSLVVLSPQSNAVAMSAIFLVTNDRRTISIGPQFQYRQNPVITDIKPLNHLINGGTLVTIFGQNLDSVANPMIELTVAFFSSPQDFFQTAMFEPCHKPANGSLIGKQMVCQMPSVVIPPDVQSKLELQDGMLSGNLDGGRGGVASAVEDDGRTIVVYAGFILDGLTTYRNITSTLPIILMDFYVQPDVYCSQGAEDSVAFLPSSNSIASVEGYGLLRGSQVADYVVTVGGRNCDIEDVSNTILSFSPPAVQPNRTSSDANCQNGGVTLAITTGYATYRCCIVYSSNSPNVSLIVGLVLGLGIPFLILLLVLIVLCCLCFSRKSCCHKDETGQEKKNPVGPITNPGYEHSTLSAVPSTSSSTAPIDGARPPSPDQSEANFYWAPEKPGGSARIKPTFSVVDKEAETT